MPGEVCHCVLFRTLNRTGPGIAFVFERLWTFCGWRRLPLGINCGLSLQAIKTGDRSSGGKVKACGEMLFQYKFLEPPRGRLRQFRFE